MYRTATVSHPAILTRGASGAWLARRWYYTPRTRRAYSVRQISAGDRRLLAEFALVLGAAGRDAADLRGLHTIVFDRLLGSGADWSVGFAALENTAAGDRVIGVCAYTPSERNAAQFAVAVAPAYREELVGRTLLSTLLRHARRAGVTRLESEIYWANRAMHMLALSTGFSVQAVAGDRTRRQLVLQLR